MFHTVDNCCIQDARNQAALRVLETDCDGLLFIDSDQTFPYNALDKLIECKKDIIGYPIVRKSAPYYPNISRWDNEKKDYVIYESYPENNLFKVDYIGMGFTYIRREVLEKLSMPFFDFVWFDINQKEKLDDKIVRSQGLIEEKQVDGSYKYKRMMGEDVYFCRKAKEAGFEIWANPFEQIGHIGNFNYMPSLYRNFERVKQSRLAKEGKDDANGVNK